jgi:hypothetical protein
LVWTLTLYDKRQYVRKAQDSLTVNDKSVNHSEETATLLTRRLR